MCKHNCKAPAISVLKIWRNKMEVEKNVNCYGKFIRIKKPMHRLHYWQDDVLIVAGHDFIKPAL